MEREARCFDRLSNRAATGPSTGSGTDPFDRPLDGLRDRPSTSSATGPSIINNLLIDRQTPTFFRHFRAGFSDGLAGRIRRGIRHRHDTLPGLPWPQAWGKMGGGTAARGVHGADSDAGGLLPEVAGCAGV